MHSKSYLWWILAPAVGYVTLLLLVAAFVVKPPALGWIGFGVAATIGIVIAGIAAVLFPHTRANAVRLHPRFGGHFRLLVVADAHCASASLCKAVSAMLAGRTADVLVVAPVIASPLLFLAEDEEREREDARVRLFETLHGLTRLGIEARGVVGADDPLQAMGDALGAFPANEILLVSPEERQAIWLEHGLDRQARDLFGVHVSSLTVDSVGAPAAR
jgi:hypothetical protein